MAIKRISDNQIADTTNAILTTLSFLNQTSVFRLPSGTQANRPTGVSVGTLRFNTDTDSAEIYKADDGTGNAGWTEVAGGGPSVGNDALIRTNGVNLTEDATVGPTANGDEKFTHGFHHGDLTIDNTKTLTIENNASLTLIDDEKPLAYQEDLIYPNCILQMAYDQSSVFHTISNTNNIGEGGTYIQGLQINNFRPMRGNSKIILEAHISHSESFVVSLGFLVNNQAVANLGSNSNSINSNVTHFNGANDGNYLTQTSWKIEYPNPGAGRRMTINVGATASWSNDQSNYPLYINDRNSGDMRSVSSITVYEIAQ